MRESSRFMRGCVLRESEPERWTRERTTVRRIPSVADNETGKFVHGRFSCVFLSSITPLRVIWFSSDFSNRRILLRHLNETQIIEPDSARGRAVVKPKARAHLHLLAVA